jgi:GntR family transcriptional regulator, transcriptional repressor for pyruvate dehydrogenase complex
MTNRKPEPKRRERLGRGRGLASGLVDELLAEIAAGALKPGDRLPPEPQLAVRFGVSRPTLRQALKTLEAAGILESRPRRGTTLARSSPRSLGPFFGAHLALAGIPLVAVAEARAALEQSLARLAARKRRAGDLAAMRAALEEQEASVNKDQDIAAEQRFHGAILEAARNPVMSAFREILSLYFERVRLPAHSKDRSRRKARTRRQHRAIYAAIRDRRSDEAARLIHKHLAPTLKPVSSASASGRKGE